MLGSAPALLGQRDGRSWDLSRFLWDRLAERRGYKWAVNTESLGFPAYTLFWHDGRGTYTPTGDWQRLLGDLRRLVREAPGY